VTGVQTCALPICYFPWSLLFHYASSSHHSPLLSLIVIIPLCFLQPSFPVTYLDRYYYIMLPPVIIPRYFPWSLLFHYASSNHHSLLSFQPVSIPVTSSNQYDSLLLLPVIITCFFPQSLTFPFASPNRYCFLLLAPAVTASASPQTSLFRTLCWLRILNRINRRFTSVNRCFRRS
jgi:hypothetical protein